MNTIIEIILIFLFAVLIYTYLLFPLVIRIIASFCKNDFLQDETLQSISILISAYNEEKVIKERIINISNLIYDFDKIEVLVGSDCSTDSTNEILTDLEKKYSWLKVYIFKERRGKVPVLNKLVDIAKNEILVFTDANTEFSQESIKILASNFNSGKVGGASGRLILKEPKENFNKSNLEKKYWGYETKIKICEGKCGVLIGASGGMYAIRRKLFNPMPENKAVTDDLFVPLSILNQGYQFIYDINSIGYEEVSHQLIHEYKRKERFAATNFQTIGYFKNLLFNKNILLSFSLWSHKILRWFTPIFFIVILITNLLLFPYNEVFKILIYIQLAFYLLAVFGFLLKNIKIKIIIFTVPFYFALANIALFIGLIKFVFKKHTAYWQSTPRI